MDSPSSSVTLNTRDGSPSAEGLAKEAAVLFQSGMFADCLRVLNQLPQKEDDPKVNYILVNYSKLYFFDHFG